MASKITVYKGDTAKGTINLKLVDACDKTIKNPFPIPASCEIEMNWPGTPSSIVIKKSQGFVTVVDANAGIISYVANPDKTLAMTTTTAEALDVIVTALLSRTGDTANTSPIILNLSSIAGLYVGGKVLGAGIPSGAKILTIDSATQITLDQNATATAAGVSLTIDGEVTTFEKTKIVDIKVRDNP